MKTRNKILSFILLLALLSGSGCAFSTKLADQSPAAPAAGGATALAGASTAANETPQAANPASGSTQAGDDTPEAALVESNFQPIALDLPTWGKVDFKPDPAASAEADFLANGLPVTLSLTDAAGITWTLTVPGLALTAPVKLKMTALTDINSSEIPGALKAGVLLEPDGLKFRYPAILTVSGGELSDKLLLFSGAQDGSSMDLVSAGEKSGSWEILHFSSLVANDGGSLHQQADVDQLKDQVSKQDLATIEMVRKFLKEHKDDLEVPVPPSIPIECTDEQSAKTNDAALDKFIADVQEPEGVLIRSLLRIKTSKQLLGMAGADVYDLELRLMNRLEKKVDLLLKTYKGKEDKLIAVSNAVLRVAKEIALLGGEHRQVLLDRVASWCAQTVDQLIADIANEHDYRKIPAVITVARWAALLSSEYPSNELSNILRKLEGVLRFKLTGTFKFTSMDSVIEVTTEMPMRLDVDPQSPGGGLGNYWKGSGPGTFNYTFTKGDDVSMTADPFNINGFISKFDACSGEAQIDFDRFFADSEVMTASGESRTFNFSKKFFESTYKAHKGTSAILDATTNGASSAAYNFPVKIHNKDVNAVDEDVEGETNCGSKCSVSFKLQLVHTPKLFK